MNLLAVLGIVLAAVAVGVGLMYAVRRLAGPDYFFEDTTRGSAIFGVVGTAFAVLLAFVMFVGFQSYNNAKSASVDEAAAVSAMFRTAEYFPQEDRDVVAGSLICYSRAVVAAWPKLGDGQSSPLVEDWRVHLEAELRGLPLDTEIQSAGYSQLLTERDARAEARRHRITESEPVVSAPVWLILGLGGLATVAFVLLFTDRREAFAVQACMMGAVAAMVAASLTLVWFLDHPYGDATGSIQPDEMQRSLTQMEDERASAVPPCDATGNHRESEV